MIANCNRCDKGICVAAKKMNIGDSCKNFRPPYDKWRLAELALAHPTSLNEALSALPFETNIDTYLERGRNGRN